MTALARSLSAAPSLRASIQSLRSSPWAMLVVVVAAGFVLSAVLPRFASDAVVNPMGGVIGVAAVGGIRRKLHRVAFNLLSVGVVAYAIADVIGLLSATPEATRAAISLFVVAYAAMAAGLAVYVAPKSRRHRRRRKRSRSR